MKPLCMCAEAECVCAVGLGAERFFPILQPFVFLFSIWPSPADELEIWFVPAHQGFGSPAAAEK